MKFEWELIYKNVSPTKGCTTNRAKVLGGWIVQDFNWLNTATNEGRPATAMVFVPDPKHQWVIDQPISNEKN